MLVVVYDSSIQINGSVTKGKKSMNHDNALPSIARFSLVEKTSKAGNLYTEGILHLNNDYQI